MTNISKRRKSSAKLKTMGDHDEFLSRITKSLYYSKLPMTDCLSLPVTELAAELFTEVKSGQTLERLDVEEASRISRNACVSPCSLVLALLYLERLKDCNPEYLQRVAPSELFLVSLMVASKFLHDDGEEDEVFNTEWAESAGLTLSEINSLEMDFLVAIDWTIFVCNNDFWDRLQRLERDIAYKEGQKRGWFSYTDLNFLMDSTQLMAVIQTVMSVSSICLATYAAGIATLLGSALVASQIPGTSLTPRQPVVSSKNTLETSQLLVPDPGPIPDDISSVNVLTSEFVIDSLSCNRSYLNFEQTENRNRTSNDIAGWEWWLSSLMTWLPDYSGLKSKLSPIGEQNMEEQTRNFVTNTKSVFDIGSHPQTNRHQVTEINWKETLSLDLEFELQDWRRYAGYIAKVTLGHRH
ncbi:protein CNPPD1 [Neodiprion virginianus]|uniref:protein CNPPD1 n=1 Tax=Neodiprion virginianus TaxID=2961670 RepID=UPI001EE778A3|nr:protein CNPPD1 [Neodiprion virginianus]